MHAWPTSPAGTRSGHKVDGVRPELTGARLNGRRLTLTFSELLARRPAPAAGGFEVRADGTARSVRGVAVSGAGVVLTLDSPATLARTVTVDYTGAGAPVLDAARNPAAAFARKPVRNVVNIVFILADDHATQAVSAYGSELISTPNIDRLAAEGVVFDRALAPNSICKPARATLLTGKYAHRHGQLTNFNKLRRRPAADSEDARPGRLRHRPARQVALELGPAGFRSLGGALRCRWAGRSRWTRRLLQSGIQSARRDAPATTEATPPTSSPIAPSPG